MDHGVTVSREDITDEDVLIVYNPYQAALYPEFKRENVIPFRLLHLLGHREAPARIFRTPLGKSGQAIRTLEALEDYAWTHGTELRHVKEFLEVDEEAVAEALGQVAA